MNDDMKELIITIVIDLVIAIALVICYSPGLLNLRPSDSSILRAGFSILAIPIAAVIFIPVNYKLLTKKSITTLDGNKAKVNVKDGNILDDIDALNNQIKNSSLLERSLMCRSCIADIFIRATEDSNDYNVPFVRSKLEYYLDMYTDTLKRAITLEKYERTSLYKKSFIEISNTIDLLQKVFFKALDQILSNALNGAELDKIVLENVMEMDGLADEKPDELKDKYS